MGERGKEWLGCLLGAGEGGRGRGKELRVLLKLFERVFTVYLICWRCRRTVEIPVQSPIPPVTAYVVVYPGTMPLVLNPSPQNLELKRASAGEGSAKGTLGRYNSNARNRMNPIVIGLASFES